MASGSSADGWIYLDGIDVCNSVRVGDSLGWPLGFTDGWNEGHPDTEGDSLGCNDSHSETEGFSDGCPLSSLDIEGFHNGWLLGFDDDWDVGQLETEEFMEGW